MLLSQASLCFPFGARSLRSKHVGPCKTPNYLTTVHRLLMLFPDQPIVDLAKHWLNIPVNSKPPMPPRANPQASVTFFKHFGQILRYVGSLDGQCHANRLFKNCPMRQNIYSKVISSEHGKLSYGSLFISIKLFSPESPHSNASTKQ